MANRSDKNHKQTAQIFNKTKTLKEAPLSLDQSLHEVQATDLEKTSF